MVIYFTGTGNSEYIARAVADRLSDEVVCANKLIKNGEKGCFESDKPWVFAFPVYLSTIAEIFADFIRAASFSGSRKAYFIATCASAIGSVPNICSEICESKGLEYMGTAKVMMPQNYIALFKMTEADEREVRQAQALEAADVISEAVKNGEKIDGPFASKIEFAATRMVEKMYNGNFTRTKKFRTTDACTGCGACAAWCPVNNIVMTSGRPTWIKSCVHCMACINRCPNEAIEYGKGTVGKERYVCRKYRSEKK